MKKLRNMFITYCLMLVVACCFGLYCTPTNQQEVPADTAPRVQMSPMTDVLLPATTDSIRDSLNRAAAAADKKATIERLKHDLKVREEYLKTHKPERE